MPVSSRASQLASPNVEQHPAGDLRRATLFRCLTIAVSPGVLHAALRSGHAGDRRSRRLSDPVTQVRTKPRLMLGLPTSNRQLRSEAGL